MLRAVQVGFRQGALHLLAAVTVLLVRAILTIGSYRIVLLMIPRGAFRTAHPELARRTSCAVARISRIVPRAHCLTQALSVQMILALRGYASEVKIGVRQSADGAFEAHAWLMSGMFVATGGTPADLANFTALTELSVRRT